MQRTAVRQAGFSLIELMISMTLGLLVLAGLMSVFSSSSRSRAEALRTNQQIENGRYAVQVVASDLQLAGYWAEFDLSAAGLATPAAKPDPCAVELASLRAAMPLHVQGYDNGASLPCLADVRPNTDVVVVRRVSTCVRGAADCVDIAGAPYFQASLCTPSGSTQVAAGTELASPDSAEHYRLDTLLSALDRHTRACRTSPPLLADLRRYIVRVYFVANNDRPGDGIPTLKRVELGAGAFSAPIPIAEGIENLQLEYGIDRDGDGAPDAFTADPDTFGGCAGTACVENWRNVTSVETYLLARNTSRSAGFVDDKTYTLGLLATGAPNTVPPPNDAYKRHVYRSSVRLNNPSGWRT